MSCPTAFLLNYDTKSYYFTLARCLSIPLSWSDILLPNIFFPIGIYCVCITWYLLVEWSFCINYITEHWKNTSIKDFFSFCLVSFREHNTNNSFSSTPIPVWAFVKSSPLLYHILKKYNTALEIINYIVLLVRALLENGLMKQKV